MSVGNGGGVLGIVQRGTNVVSHAAIDRDVRPDARNHLDRSHPIHRHARRTDYRPARLDRQDRFRQAGSLARRPRRFRNDARPVRRRLRLLVVQVGDAESAAGREMPHLDTMRVPHQRRESDQFLDCRDVRVRLEQLRADVGVVAEQLQLGPGQEADHRLGSLAIGDREPEFGIRDTGADLPMRVNIDARVQSQEYSRSRAETLGDVSQMADLVQVVDHDLADPRLERLPKLLWPLVVAVERDLLRVDPSGQSHRQFAT